jgi:hypothetical protein
MAPNSSTEARGLRAALAAMIVHVSVCTSAGSVPGTAFAASRGPISGLARRAAISRAPSMAVGDQEKFRPTHGPRDPIKDFLTQRALQTQLFTLSHSGEVSTFEFLESFKDHQGEHTHNLARAPGRTATRPDASGAAPDDGTVVRSCLQALELACIARIVVLCDATGTRASSQHVRFQKRQCVRLI